MRRAVGIIRVSQSKGREGESFISPADQRKRIDDKCGQMGLSLVSTAEEIDVSGGKPLDARRGLLEAVETIEQGQAEVLVVGYFDRLVRSLRVQGEVVSRVEAAGGEVLTVDYGRVSEETAAKWLSGTIMGAFFEYYRRAAGERGAESQANAVARGVCPFPDVPPGLALDDANRVVHTGDLPAVRAAFEMRADGSTIREVRAFLGAQGIQRSYHGVQAMLANRLYLGEIHFGALENLKAHKLAIERDLFNRVQRVKVSRGRRAKSDRLLARLGVLRCASCGARMVVGTQTQNGRSYPMYRCPPVGDCTQRVTIGAVIAESVVTEAVKEVLADEEGRASAEQDARSAVDEAEKAQADLDAAIGAFMGLEDEPAAVRRLAELRAVRDEKRERAAHLGGLRSARTVSVADWDDLSLAAKRGLIRATVDRATVRKGGVGIERITLHFFGE